MKKELVNQRITKTVWANRTFLYLTSIFLAGLVSGCSSPKPIEKAEKTTQGTFSITSKTLDADINGWKYFGFYIFNSAKDITIQPVNPVSETTANSTRAAYIAQNLRQDLNKLMGMDITIPSSYLSQQAKLGNDATDAAQNSLQTYLDKSHTTVVSIAEGHHNIGDFISTRLNPKEKDLKDAETFGQIAKIAQNNIYDRFNLFFAGVAQINYATSITTNIVGAQARLVISPALLAQASSQRISYPKDYANASDERTGSSVFYAANLSRLIIESTNGDTMQCELYNSRDARKVGACVEPGGDTYIISTYLNKFAK